MLLVKMHMDTRKSFRKNIFHHVISTSAKSLLYLFISRITAGANRWDTMCTNKKKIKVKGE